MTAPTVYLVDDQDAVRKALLRLLASAGVPASGFASAQAFLDSGAAALPGCLVLDLAMPGMDGLALQAALAAQGSLLPVIFLSGEADLDAGVRAMKVGAADFLTKPVDETRLLAAVDAGFARNALARAAGEARADTLARLATLTPREREVLDLIVEGLLNKQVAFALGTVEKTVKTHRGRVMAKMGARSMSALIRMVDRVRGDAA